MIFLQVEVGLVAFASEASAFNSRQSAMAEQLSANQIAATSQYCTRRRYYFPKVAAGATTEVFATSASHPQGNSIGLCRQRCARQ